MRYKKRCPVCGSIFTTDRTQTKYCGLVCKDIAMKKQLREWRENHPGYHAEKCAKPENVTDPNSLADNLVKSLNDSKNFLNDSKIREQLK